MHTAWTRNQGLTKMEMEMWLVSLCNLCLWGFRNRDPILQWVLTMLLGRLVLVILKQHVAFFQAVLASYIFGLVLAFVANSVTQLGQPGKFFLWGSAEHELIGWVYCNIAYIKNLVLHFLSLPPLPTVLLHSPLPSSAIHCAVHTAGRVGHCSFSRWGDPVMVIHRCTIFWDACSLASQ